MIYRAVVWAALPLLLVAVSGGADQRPLHMFMRVRKLKADFLEKGTLFVARDAYDRTTGGLPTKMNERLYWTDGDKVEPIRSLKQLDGRVRLRDKEQALSFVRLRTAPSLLHVFRPLWAEVLTYEAVTPALLFALDDPDVEMWLSLRLDGGGGIVSDATLGALGIKPATATALPDGRYRIERAVVVQGFRKGLFREEKWITEEVTAKGGYELTKSVPLRRPAICAVRWDLAPAK